LEREAHVTTGELMDMAKSNTPNAELPAVHQGYSVGTLTHNMMGILVAMLFNFFIFKHAETQVTEILIGASAVYVLGMGVIALFFLWRLYQSLKRSPQVDKFNTAAY
jgi:uncharacterized membrane protein